MSVVVSGLTKIYGAQKALDNVSFSAQKGDILGFLGPNGAGKSTTMKILSCFIPQSSGEALVCGMNVKTESLEIRNILGYLPESNPLYKDMYIKEYLAYVARLYKLANPMKRVSDMITLTGLGSEQNKLIGQLSKGYKQRVGLAQAMIHNPEVLIMDEPTSGLDPNQLAEIRNVIREIGREKVVIFSTHIMQEVEALCNRVVIINKGVIAIDDDIKSLGKLSKSGNVVTIQFSKDSKVNTVLFKEISGLSDVTKMADNSYQFSSSDQSDIRVQLFETSVAQGLKIIRMEQKTFSMENIFQQLTASNS
ncbi:MAG: gliding motility-associated ABC transporter ATP-binding subunit GldA [Saprospiraceae bacterium]